MVLSLRTVFVSGAMLVRNIKINRECGKTVKEELLQKKCRLLGAKIKYLRTIAGMNQTALANRVGISYQYLSRLECGKQAPSLQLLMSIAKSLNVDVATLVNDSR